ncbi:radical SAM/SPASM domain-containing protein [Thermodesulfobacteriota bacterium]
MANSYIETFSSFREKIGRGQTHLKSLFAYNSHLRQSRLKGPLELQIQTVDRCNAACIMCPYASTKESGPPNYMPEELFSKILNDLSEVNTANSICLMLQNEPLIDHFLDGRIQETKRILGAQCQLKVVTNGSLLTTDRVDSLIASGLDQIAVSIDAHQEDTFHAIRKGLNFSKIVENTKELLRRRGNTKVSIKFLRQIANEGEEEDFARFWKSHGARVRFAEMANRAGALNEFERLKSAHVNPFRILASSILNRIMPTCALPFTRMYILWDGRVILCCHDWDIKDIVGDLTKQSISQVWNGEKMNHYRHLLWTRRTEKSVICRDCSLAKGFWTV